MDLAAWPNSEIVHRQIAIEYGMPIEAWEAQTGRKLEHGLYKNIQAQNTSRDAAVQQARAENRFRFSQ